MPDMNLVLALGVILTAGLFGSKLLRRLGLPSVTGYIIIGILLGPSVSGIVPAGVIEQLDVLTSITLAVVAYLIGGSLRLDSLRGLGSSVLWVTFFQSIGAWLLVTALLSFALLRAIPDATFREFAFPLAFVVGAISSATAPAATMAIVREAKAKGPLTTTLLAVVALDDGVAVVAFAIALGVSTTLVIPGAAVTAGTVLFEPLGHIVASIAVGAGLSPLVILGMRSVRGRDAQMALLFGAILLCGGLCLLLGLSLIMANMMLGFVVVNVLRRSDEPSVLGEMETILYTLFFVLAGLHFDLSVLGTAGVLALVIVGSRCVGKYGGTVLGATIAHAPEAVRRYLGFALLPKAGVTVGLALLAAAEFPAFGGLMMNAVLASTIVNELIAPPLTRMAISRAGEYYAREA